MATTLRKMITGSLRLLNAVQANEAPTDDDMQICIEALNAMIDSWSNNSLNIYSINPYYFMMAANQKTYTLGTGGDWDIPRPMAIENAYVSYNAVIDNSTTPPSLMSSAQSVDLPMAMWTDDQYAAVSVKDTTSTYPMALYDTGDYPLRTIILFPIPNQAQPITLWLRQPLFAEFASLDQEIDFPKGYERAFRFNLAVEVAAEFGKSIPDSVSTTASNSQRELMTLNFVPGIAVAPPGIRGKRGMFSWITGDTISP